MRKGTRDGEAERLLRSEMQANCEDLTLVVASDLRKLVMVYCMY